MTKKGKYIFAAILTLAMLCSCGRNEGNKLDDGWKHNQEETREEISTVVIRDDLPEKNGYNVIFDVEKAISLGMFKLKGKGTISAFIQDGYLILFNDYGEEFAEIVFDGDLPEDTEDKKLSKFTDMNFDGYNDIGILTSEDEKGKIYQCYVYAPDEKCFEKNTDLSALYSPKFDAENKTVVSREKKENGKTVTKNYVWTDGVLTEE